LGHLHTNGSTANPHFDRRRRGGREGRRGGRRGQCGHAGVFSSASFWRGRKGGKEGGRGDYGAGAEERGES